MVKTTKLNREGRRLIQMYHTFPAGEILGDPNPEEMRKYRKWKEYKGKNPKN